jgi:hypothetical protein
MNAKLMAAKTRAWFVRNERPIVYTTIAILGSVAWAQRTQLLDVASYMEKNAPELANEYYSGE